MSELWLPLLIAYLIGSLPFALMISRISRNIDPRQIGDKNPGAKNIFKHVGKLEGVLVCIFDILKAYATIYLGKVFNLDIFALFAMSVLVILGHNWSIFMHFHGGQGMAATVGVSLGLAPLSTLLALLIWGVTLLFTHHWNLSAAIGLILLPIVTWEIYHNLQTSLFITSLLPLIGIRKFLKNLEFARIEHSKNL
jgi:glycerol-3-phosphate acyltransferase PlsY